MELSAGHPIEEFFEKAKRAGSFFPISGDIVGGWHKSRDAFAVKGGRTGGGTGACFRIYHI